MSHGRFLHPRLRREFIEFLSRRAGCRAVSRRTTLTRCGIGWSLADASVLRGCPACRFSRALPSIFIPRPVAAGCPTCGDGGSRSGYAVGSVSLSLCAFIIARFRLSVKHFFYFFWGSSLFVSLSIPPESCPYFVDAESVLQRIFAAYNLAGVVSQSAGLWGFPSPCDRDCEVLLTLVGLTFTAFPRNGAAASALPRPF